MAASAVAEAVLAAGAEVSPVDCRLERWLLDTAMGDWRRQWWRRAGARGPMHGRQMGTKCCSACQVGLTAFCWSQAQAPAAPQLEVSAVLSAMAVPHSVDMPVDDGLVTLDVALSQQLTAVTVDGSGQFCVNPPYRPLGRALLRWRALLARGWKVCETPMGRTRS
jgi:hypothetical protein